MNCYASTVINIALAEVGYLEKKSNKSLESKTANAGSANYTKYGRDMHDIYPAVMDFPAAWCDCFVDWCFQKAYGVSNAKGLLGGNFDDYTVNSAQLYKNKKAWGTTPKVGAQIFFKNSKRICHTGLVYDYDAKYVYTIEGNTSGASGVIANGGGVCKKKYSRNDSAIAGYGYPKYDAEPTTSTSKPAVSTTEAKANTKVANIKTGQIWLNNNYGDTLVKYCGAELVVDGDYGSKTDAACVCVWKDVVNRKYGSKLTPSNSNFLASCKKAAAKAEIKKGDSGTLVMIAKIVLSAKGYYTGTMNCTFDAALATAVGKFQKAVNIKDDKIIGENTWYKMFN